MRSMGPLKGKIDVDQEIFFLFSMRGAVGKKPESILWAEVIQIFGFFKFNNISGLNDNKRLQKRDCIFADPLFGNAGIAVKTDLNKINCMVKERVSLNIKGVRLQCEMLIKFKLYIVFKNRGCSYDL